LTERAFIALGSNIEPEGYLPRAVEYLKTLGTITSVSTVYQNPAIGRPEQDDYLNAAVLLQTEFSVDQLRVELRAIEEKLDRIRTGDSYAPRTIDLDLALFGSTVILTSTLQLPDPDIETRPVLAQTLAELDPDMIHPRSGKTLGQISAKMPLQSMLQSRPEITQSIKCAADLEALL
jgi:2-amino-4-hydroxy-6-hydroxymethyldihydropteridine diphosphokinase